MAGEPVLREVIMAVKGGNIVGRSPADKIRIDILIIPAGQGVQILCPDKGSVILVEIRVCRNRYIKIILDLVSCTMPAISGGTGYSSRIFRSLRRARIMVELPETKYISSPIMVNERT